MVTPSSSHGRLCHLYSPMKKLDMYKTVLSYHDRILEKLHLSYGAKCLIPELQRCLLVKLCPLVHMAKREGRRGNKRGERKVKGLRS